MMRDFNQNPFIVIWELTRACQLKCLHCRAEAQYHRDPRELTFEEGKKTSKRVPFDIKTTAGQHYRRVVLQAKMREGKTAKGGIRYEDVLNKGLTGQVDGLGRAPKGVNDGNGFVFISHIGHVYPSGLLPVKAGNVRETPLADIYRHSPIFQDLRNPDKYKGKCGVCEFRYVCGGSRSRAYAVTGDYLESEPYCVYIPKALRTKEQSQR